MGARTIFAYSSSTSSSSSSSQSSGGHRQREEKAMDKFEHPSLHHPPPPLPPRRSILFRSKIQHRHHHPFPPPLTSQHRPNLFEHCPVDGPHYAPPVGCPHHQRLEGASKLRVHPPKRLKKGHKLHRKLMKAYKFPRSAGHDAHHHHHIHFLPLNKGFFRNLSGHPPPPGFCPHGMEATWEGLNPPPGFLHHHHPRCHGKHPLPPYPRPPLIKSEVAGFEVALVSPRARLEASAERPIKESGTMPLASDNPPADKAASVVLAS